jgi:hypothetical protein
MTTRDYRGALINGLQKHHGLLAAYLEAAERIDWRALGKVSIDGMLKPVRLDANRVPSLAELPEVGPPGSSMSPFIFRRANLVRAV